MNSPVLPLTARRTWTRRILCAGFLLALVVGWGSNRQPADVTRPVSWHRSASADDHPPQTDVLRIATYNIHGGKGRDGQVDLRRIAQDLKDIDVAGLYEVRANPLVTQAKILGEAAGLNALFLATERRWWHDHVGNAILAKLPVQSVQRIHLVGTRGKAFRQAVLVDVPLNDALVHVLATHIDSQQDREPQLQAVIRLFKSLEPPAILMGDLNSGPLDPQIAKLLAQPGVESVLDESSTDNVDWIIVRGLECVAAERVDSAASDHPLVKATLRLPMRSISPTD